MLRGIALLFVLVSNAWEWFSGFHLLPNAARAELLAGANQVVESATAVLVQGKAIRTFAFLFGLGFGVQMLRAEERAVAIVPLYRRRLLVLFGIGVLHATLLALLQSGGYAPMVHANLSYLWTDLVDLVPSSV